MEPGGCVCGVVEWWKIALREKETMMRARRMLGDGTGMISESWGDVEVEILWGGGVLVCGGDC